MRKLIRNRSALALTAARVFAVANCPAILAASLLKGELTLQNCKLITVLRSTVDMDLSEPARVKPERQRSKVIQRREFFQIRILATIFQWANMALMAS